MNILSYSRNQYEFTICFTNWLDIYLFSRIYFLFREFSMNSQWNRHTINKNSLSVSRFLFEFTMLTRIHYLFQEFILNPLSFSWFHYEFAIYFVISLWIYHLFRDLIMNLLSFYREINIKFTICFAISLGIYHFFAKSPPISRIFNEFKMKPQYNK